MEYNLGNFGSKLRADELDNALQLNQPQGTTNFNAGTAAPLAQPAQQQSQVNSNGAVDAMGAVRQAKDDEVPGEQKKQGGGLKKVLGLVGSVVAFL